MAGADTQLSPTRPQPIVGDVTRRKQDRAVNFLGDKGDFFVGV